MSGADRISLVVLAVIVLWNLSTMATSLSGIRDHLVKTEERKRREALYGSDDNGQREENAYWWASNLHPLTRAARQMLALTSGRAR